MKKMPKKSARQWILEARDAGHTEIDQITAYIVEKGGSVNRNNLYQSLYNLKNGQPKRGKEAMFDYIALAQATKNNRIELLAAVNLLNKAADDYGMEFSLFCKALLELEKLRESLK